MKLFKFGSQTLSLALYLLPFIGLQYELKQPDEWVYSKLPKKMKEKGTFLEFQDIIIKGSEFIKAIKAFKSSAEE